MITLPIDGVLDEVLDRLDANDRLIVEAPPGAGKTTRLPPALLDAPWCNRTVLVSEPRRIAARLAATRVASERGGRLGEEIGYRVRFDDKTSSSTRLVYATEGLLLRSRLDTVRADREDTFDDISLLVLDEVHERSAELDALMALAKRAQRMRREALRRREADSPLRIVAMSATPDLEALSNYWEKPPIVASRGRAYEVQVQHQPRPDDRPLEKRVRSAVRERLDAKGDILVFLPGAAEIRRCQAALSEAFSAHANVLPLHGDLPLEAQARVIGEPASSLKRIVLSTNVAESSVTIPGVTTVIDTGQARIAYHDPFTGGRRLELSQISQARCIQRAGRAGRTAPGVCVRLYTRGDLESRPAQETPALSRNDLTELTLLLLASGLSPEDLSFVSQPAGSAWSGARQQLKLLGALDGNALSRVGRMMARLPLPPRLARLLVEARQQDVFDLGTRAAALLSERDIRRKPTLEDRGRGSLDVVVGDSDLDALLDLYDEAEAANFRAGELRRLGLDLATVRRVERVQTQLARLKKHLSVEGRPSASRTAHERLTRSLLAAFPDQVALRKPPSNRLQLATGAMGQLDERSCVKNAALLLALAADYPRGRRAGATIRLAVRLAPDQLVDWLPDQIEAHEEYVYDPSRDVVDAVSSFRYGKVVLDESRVRAVPSEATAPILARAARVKGKAAYDPDDHLGTLLERLRLLSTHLPDVLTPEDFLSIARDEDVALEHACLYCSGLADLQNLNLGSAIAEQLSSMARAALERDVPATLRLPGGQKLHIEYSADRPPWAQSRLQDFFSMTETPHLCRGRVPLSLHLLAPNRRAVQVTTDLASFWERHYPELRKQLMRRYPKHSWPEDGRTATPPPPGRLR